MAKQSSSDYRQQELQQTVDSTLQLKTIIGNGYGYTWSVPHQMLHQSFEDQQEGRRVPLPRIHMAKPMQVDLPS